MMELSRSSYYYQPKPSIILKQKQEADLKDRIERIICDQPGYGYRPVTHQLKKDGYIINHKRVLRIMRENALLRPVRKRSFIATTNSEHAYTRYPNLTRGFKSKAINQLWVSDITYIRILTGFVFLAVIMDAFSRKVIGYALSKKLSLELALRALEMAIRDRSPQAGCIHHSDQGIQYAATKYTQALKENGFKISMSRKGNPYDNAIAERFMRTLKYEEVYLWDYQTTNDVAQRIPFFIAEVYNKKRLHSALGYLSPVEFETKMSNNNQEFCQSITVS
jgi:putative transposase